MSKTQKNNKFYYETKIKDLTDEVSFYRTMIKKLRQDKKDLELQLDVMYGVYDEPPQESIPYDY